jgi:hypothetical protein
MCPAQLKLTIGLSAVFSFPQEDIFIMRKTICCIHNGMDNTNYFLLSDVARILRCQPYQIVYLLTTRQVPEPALRMGNRRVFTIADVHRIAEILQVQMAQELQDGKEAHER